MLLRALPISLLNAHHPSRKCVSGFGHPPGKGMLPNIHSKPSLKQLWPAPMHPTVGYQGEEFSTSLFSSPPQEDAEGSEVIPLTSCFPVKTSPKSLTVPHKTFFVICSPAFWPPLDGFHILLKLWGPELHTILQMRLHRCWIRGDSHLF